MGKELPESFVLFINRPFGFRYPDFTKEKRHLRKELLKLIKSEKKKYKSLMKVKHPDCYYRLKQYL